MLREIVAQQDRVHIVLYKRVKICVESNRAISKAVLLAEAQMRFLIVAYRHDLRACFFRHTDQTPATPHAIADVTDTKYAQAYFFVFHFRDLYQPLFLLYVFFRITCRYSINL